MTPREISEAGVMSVAPGLGIHPLRNGIGPCPACGASNRSTKNHKDGRGPIGMTHDGRGWRCHVCSAGGDAVTLASYAVGGNGSCTKEAIERAENAMGAPMAEVSTRLIFAPKDYPPREEVLCLIRMCSSNPCNTATRKWLADRGFRRILLCGAGLCFLRKQCGLPSWAARWPEKGYNILFPMHDHNGIIRNVRARNTTGADIKELSPKGYRGSGLVFANNKAVGALFGHAVDGWIIAEGSPDFLTWCEWLSVRCNNIAVLGIGSGSWNKGFAEKINKSDKIIIATHNDDAGHKYADEITKTLDNKDITRWIPGPPYEKCDANDILKQGVYCYPRCLE